jgi:hypothetical protein
MMDDRTEYLLPPTANGKTPHAGKVTKWLEARGLTGFDVFVREDGWVRVLSNQDPRPVWDEYQPQEPDTDAFRQTVVSGIDLLADPRAKTEDIRRVLRAFLVLWREGQL